MKWLGEGEGIGALGEGEENNMEREMLRGEVVLELPGGTSAS